jgi:hypothetical protein
MNNQPLHQKIAKHTLSFIVMQINMNQIKSWCGILLTGGLLAGFAPAAQSGLFTGAFAPANWTQTPVSANDGVFGFTGSGSATLLTLQSSATTGFSDTLMGLKSPYLSAAETVNFDWTLTANGNLGTPQAYFYVGSTTYDLSGSSGTLTGIEIPANTPVYFELMGDMSPGKAPAELEIVGVPETGNALAGLLVLGAAGFEWFRRKQTVAG